MKSGRSRKRYRDAFRRHAPVLRAWGIFLFWIALFSTLAVAGAAKWLEPRLIELVAWATAGTLELIGREAVASGEFVYGAGLSFEIISACTALQPMLLVVAAVFAYPCRWHEKAAGVAVGIGGLFVINLVRLVSLYFVGLYRPELFERVHILVWQPLVMLAAVALWLFWVLQLTRPDVLPAADR